jgi:hypothetical protein
MDATRQRAIARRFAFDDWRDLTTLGRNLFVWRYLLLAH